MKFLLVCLFFTVTSFGQAEPSDEEQTRFLGALSYLHALNGTLGPNGLSFDRPVELEKAYTAIMNTNPAALIREPLMKFWNDYKRPIGAELTVNNLLLYEASGDFYTVVMKHLSAVIAKRNESIQRMDAVSPVEDNNLSVYINLQMPNFLRRVPSQSEAVQFLEALIQAEGIYKDFKIPSIKDLAGYLLSLPLTKDEMVRVVMSLASENGVRLSSLVNEDLGERAFRDLIRFVEGGSVDDILIEVVGTYPNGALRLQNISSIASDAERFTNILVKGYEIALNRKADEQFLMTIASQISRNFRKYPSLANKYKISLLRRLRWPPISTCEWHIASVERSVREGRSINLPKK